MDGYADVSEMIGGSMVLLQASTGRIEVLDESMNNCI